MSRFYGAMTSLDAIVGALSIEGIDVGAATSVDLYSRGLDCHNLGGYRVPMTRFSTWVAAWVGRVVSSLIISAVG
ncbi:MAG: hypothetical protein ABIQ73_10645 [Acidimicrobiales bacterium]